MTSPGQPDGTTQPAPDPAGSPPQPAAPVAATRHHRVHRTRVGGVWVGFALAAVVLLLLLIFILENGQKASISYFGAHGHLPLGVALLLAAVAGALLVIIQGSGRIMQLRRTARRHRAVDTAAARTATSGSPVAPASPPQQPASPAAQPGDQA
jgi:lipopolysaccharide assembly protein A